jgi:hypothetical protein
MKNIILIFLISIAALSGQSQIKTTQTAFVSFYSELEEVLAENYSGISELNTETADSFSVLQFKVLCLKMLLCKNILMKKM